MTPTKEHEPSLESAQTMVMAETEVSNVNNVNINNADHNGHDSIETVDNDGDSNAAANEMVRQFSLEIIRSVSHATDRHQHPVAGESSALDPTSPRFDARLWVRTLLHNCSQDPHKFPRPTAGVAYRNLKVHGFGGSATDVQRDVLNVLTQGPLLAYQWLRSRRRQVPILHQMDGLVRSGEMLLVLGRPGSGVTTLLKTLAGEEGQGLVLGSDSSVSYQGIPLSVMQSRFRGEVVYQAETDVHFPQLTVGQTLQFAAEARTPRVRPSLPGIEGSVTRSAYATHLRDVVMAMFGISHTVNTRVGSDLVRGVSGGERKRVSIAESMLSGVGSTSGMGTVVQCWDNATRGLDSATALQFAKSVRLSTELAGTTALVAMYQASEAAYSLFDRVCLLYEGRQIYFGPADAARAYFEEMGYLCPPRQTTADFLTSLTNPGERRVRPGVHPDSVPRTPDEFATAWKSSALNKRLMADLDEVDAGSDGSAVDVMAAARRTQQAALTHPKSPYTLSFPQQVALCMRRGVQRLRGDATFFVVTVAGNLVISLVLGSVFFQLPDDASSINSRCIVLFFAILFNALSSALEILSLYAQRPIVEKHARYALYQPAAEAVASALCEMPSKILSALAFNIPLYFMANLRHGAGHFFIFLLFGFSCTLTMSTVLRTIGQASRTVHQALTPAAVMILALVIYTGFVLPTSAMQGWLRWVARVNPIAYAYESLVVNELGGGRTFPCTQFVPAYPGLDPTQKTCATAGAAPGADFVVGNVILQGSYGYEDSHKWRNLGILAAFMVFFFSLYLLAAEMVTEAESKGEVLVFRKKQKPAEGPKRVSEEKPSEDNSKTATSEKNIGSKGIFHWRDVCYDIPVAGGETRRLLDHVDGWVKPGTLTVLMGVSGAGKTTLLDVLAARVTTGVVSGAMQVDGVVRGSAFQQRTTGYVQQQDVHLTTSTVREALRFSSELRQPSAVSLADKHAYVEEVLELLEMAEYADAVVAGLNVEQRKRLTIAVELAAKPDLLLFLDEPTSGLDSQTAWSVTTLVRRLADHGQAVLCTIHQPSSLLFEQFGRLLLLAAGGRTVYFGEIGPHGETLIKYLEKNRSPESTVPDCAPDENPAEWMLRVIGAARDEVSITDHVQDWAATWRASSEYRQVQSELAQLEGVTGPGASSVDIDDGAPTYAAPFTTQLVAVTRRVAQQYWRTPSYIYAKLALCFGTALLIGLSFKGAPLTETGLQSQMFSLFLLLVIFAFLTYQTMPHFIQQRELFEVRERAARTYHWAMFVLANILVEIPWNTLAALLVFLPFYYLVGMQNNAVPTHAVAERSGLMFLFLWVFLLFESTFADMVVAGAPTAELGATIALLLFAFCLIFCGVMVPASSLPGFWSFMYRVSPLTYLIGGLLATGVAQNDVTCSTLELLSFQPPANTTCAAYMEPFMQLAGGRLANPGATFPDACQFCSLATTDAYLATVNIFYSQRWRNLGLMFAYIVFNVAAALGLYWLARAPKTGFKVRVASAWGRLTKVTKK